MIIYGCHIERSRDAYNMMNTFKRQVVKFFVSKKIIIQLNFKRFLERAKKLFFNKLLSSFFAIDILYSNNVMSNI